MLSPTTMCSYWNGDWPFLRHVSLPLSLYILSAFSSVVKFQAPPPSPLSTRRREKQAIGRVGNCRKKKMTALELQLPPGFRFHPTDEELVMHYLCRKCASQPIAVPIIADIDLYKFDPWQLPEMALYGEKKWYFFSPRDRKYPNGSRPNRAAGTGYWKATGADKPVGHPKPLGIKKALVFYAGKAPRGEKTNWIMHEYRLADVDRSVRRKNSLRLDDWVLCCIYNKKGTMERHVPGNRQLNCSPTAADRKPSPETLKLPPMGPAMAPPPPPPPPPPATPPMGTLTTNNYVYFDTSDSVPKIHTTDSSCSEQVMSPDMEVQSEPKWNPSWEVPIRFPSNYDGTVAAAPLPPPTTTISAAAGYDPRFVASGNQMSPLQDMFMYLQKPF